jgi:hypothetical protein
MERHFSQLDKNERGGKGRDEVYNAAMGFVRRLTH